MGRSRSLGRQKGWGGKAREARQKPLAHDEVLLVDWLRRVEAPRVDGRLAEDEFLLAPLQFVELEERRVVVTTALALFFALAAAAAEGTERRR